MVLKPLEFSDCLLDSPYFRENLHSHEKELERTSRAIKSLIQECKDLLNAAKNLSKAQRSFSSTLMSFEFECIDTEQTEDEVSIANSLKQFGRLIAMIEDQRDILLDRAYEHFILPLETFRKEQIGGAKEGKKKFEKETAKFYSSVDRYLNQKTNKGTEASLKEADAALQMEQRHFCQASMSYVLLLQEVQERKKFEFVEPLLGFMLQWLTFYHQGQDVHNDFKPYMNDLQLKIQKTRDNFNAMQEEAEQLMNKMLEKPAEQPPQNKAYTRQGYLFMQEKSKLPKGLGTTWTKYFCQYKKETKQLTMLQYSQATGKPVPTHTEEVLTLTSCVRRASDSIDKRFCFDITVSDRNGVVTLQALSEEDRRAWLDAMDGREPVYSAPISTNDTSNLASLDDVGINFVNKCIQAIEERGIEDQGLYRVVGVSSKVNKLLSMGLDRRKGDKLDLSNPEEWEIKTITSALKSYFRTLPEPLMTFNLHEQLIAAAKKEQKGRRVHEIHKLVHQLPKANKDLLELLGRHLQRVTASCDKNLMTVSNVGVCFGPTLMRPREETMAAIMDIKFCNIVVEIIIENYEQIFKSDPSSTDYSESKAPTLMNSKPAAASSKPPLPAAPPQLSQNRSPMGPSSAQGQTQFFAADDNLPNSTQNSPNSGLAGVGARGVSSPSPSSDNGGYANVTYAQVRARLRPTSGLYNQYTAGEQPSSNSSSTESLNSRSSNQSSPPIGAKSQPADNRRQPHIYQNVQANVRVPGTNRYPAPSEHSDLFSNYSPWKVRTLYACVAENESELSFEPNQIIYNVRKSKEPGWLEGQLEGKTGLIPANYVEYLN